MSEDARRVTHQGVDGPPEGLYRYDRTVNKRVPTLDDVTEEDVGFFREHGYLVVDEFLDESELDAALAGMMDLLDEGSEEYVQFRPGLADELDADDLEPGVDDPNDLPPAVKQDYVRKFMWFVDRSPGMRAPSERADLRSVVSEIVGGEPEMFQDMAHIKPPEGGPEKPWHQDQAYFELALDAPVVGAWVALDEATAENGCMHVIPGSHREGPVTHYDRRDWQICDTDVHVDRDVMATLDPGGLLLFDGLIHHGTPPNESAQRRRALQFHYTAADAEWLDERTSAFGDPENDVDC